MFVRHVSRTLLILSAALVVVSSAPPAFAARGYAARACGLDLNKNGIVGEAADCTVCRGGATNADVDGNGVADRQVYVSCGNGQNNTSCGAPNAPCNTIQYALSGSNTGFAGRIQAPAANQIQAVCFQGTCNEELNLTQDGAAGTFTRPATGSEAQNFEVPRFPFMIVGWDTDNDGKYPPCDTASSGCSGGNGGNALAVLDGNSPTIRDIVFDGGRSRLEMAHFAVRDYGHRDCGSCDAGFAWLGNNSHMLFHDIEMQDMIRNIEWPPCGGQATPILVNHLGAAPKWVAFDNTRCLDCGGWWFRGANDNNPWGPFMVKNFTGRGRSATNTPGCRGVLAWKTWGLNQQYYQMIDSIFDAGLESYPGEEYHGGGGIQQCMQGVRVVNNLIRNFDSSLTLQPWDGCNGCACESRPIDDVVIDRNEFVNDIATEANDRTFLLVTSQPNTPSSLYVNNLRISNNVFRNTVQMRAHIDNGSSRSGSTPIPGTHRYLNNTFYGNVTAAGGWGALMIQNQAGLSQPMQNHDVRNNLFAGITSSATKMVFTVFAPTNFVAENNVYDPDGSLVWRNQTARTSIAQWQTDLGGCPGAGNDCAAAECAASLVSANDMHLTSGDTCAMGKGQNVSSFTAIDMDGDARPLGGSWDAGADEAGGGGGAPSPPVLLDVTPQ